MTREEAIAFFEDMNECTYGNLEAVEMAISALSDYDKMQKISLDLAFENDELMNKSRWNPVSERLPEEDGRYLCTYETEFGVCVDFGKFYKGDWFVGRVIAWQPLPEPYKAER